MMIEGSGSIPLTSGSGSGRPKNMWIRRIQIRIRFRIRNTGFQNNCLFLIPLLYFKVSNNTPVLLIRIRDPVVFLSLDPEWKKIIIQDLEFKILKFFVVDPDPGSGMEKFGPGISIPDPQHCNSGASFTPEIAVHKKARPL
jgi:hypothetical protein